MICYQYSTVFTALDITGPSKWQNRFYRGALPPCITFDNFDNGLLSRIVSSLIQWFCLFLHSIVDVLYVLCLYCDKCTVGRCICTICTVSVLCTVLTTQIVFVLKILAILDTGQFPTHCVILAPSSWSRLPGTGCRTVICIAEEQSSPAPANMELVALNLTKSGTG